MSENKSNDLKGVLYACSTAFLWGFLAIALKFTVGKIDVMSIIWVRFLVAFVLLSVFLFFTDRESLKILKRPPVLALIAALGLAFNYYGYMEGLKLTTPSNAQIIIQIAPLLLVVVGFIVYKEKIKKVQGLGFLFAACGFVLFYKDQFDKQTDGGAVYDKGVILVVLAALAWVVYAALQKKLVQKYSPQSINLILYLVATVIYVPMADFPAIGALSWPIFLLLFFLGMNTLLAYGFLAEAFKYTAANKIGIIVTLNPIITLVTMAILGAMEVTWIKAENISYLGITGAGLLVTGAILVISAGRK